MSNFPMPKRYQTHTITWWKRVAMNAAGESIFDPPILLSGRWENKSELFRTRDGDEAVSKSIAYLNRDVEIGDYLLEGKSTIRDPSLTSALEIKAFSKTPDLRNITNTRKATL